MHRGRNLLCVFCSQNSVSWLSTSLGVSRCTALRALSLVTSRSPLYTPPPFAHLCLFNGLEPPNFRVSQTPRPPSWGSFSLGACHTSSRLIALMAQLAIFCRLASVRAPRLGQAPMDFMGKIAAPAGRCGAIQGIAILQT